MKIEPRKTAAQPKYAMVLAAAAAVVLSGCTVDLAGKTTLSGDVAVQISEPEPQIDGEMEFYPAKTEPVMTDVPPENSGEMALTDLVAAASAEPLKAGFSKLDIELEETDGFADAAGTPHPAWFIDRENEYLVCFYDEDTGAEELYAQIGAEQFDWGYAGWASHPDSSEENTDYRTAFIAVSPERLTVLTEEQAEQIARDIKDAAFFKPEVQTDEN